jgi:hypothetical protein
MAILELYYSPRVVTTKRFSGTFELSKRFSGTFELSHVVTTLRLYARELY